MTNYAAIREFILCGNWKAARLEAVGDLVAEDYCDRHSLPRFRSVAGSGDGYGSGYGDGDGNGDGSGYGSGDGDGDGNGYGYGYGYGDGQFPLQRAAA